MPTLAIDIGGTKTSAALIDEDNDDAFLKHTSWTSPPTAEEAIAQILTTCTPWTQQATRAGVSFGGQFDFPTQTCICSMHVPGWDGVEISRKLREHFDLPVITDNDANVAALGEYQAAPSDQRDPLLYVTISTGVGAAVIVNGTPVRGAHSLAGELGHLPIGYDKACNCGQQGCLERAVSGYWIERDHGQPAEQYLQDPHHHAAWIADLAQGLWSATMLLDPALIVVGGGMSAQGDRLTEPLRAELARKAEQSHRTAPALELGDPSGRTVLLGAAIMAREVARGSRG